MGSVLELFVTLLFAAEDDFKMGFLPQFPHTCFLIFEDTKLFL